MLLTWVQGLAKIEFWKQALLSEKTIPSEPLRAAVTIAAELRETKKRKRNS